MRRKLPLFALALGVLVLLAATGIVLYLRASGLPARDGEHALAGLEAAVTVRWDRWGVPHVDAASDGDAVAALGYLHANDRLTQMELGRRAAFGRLAEVVGEAAVETDVYFRTLRLRSTAEAMWEAAGPDSRRLLEAYARGVNAWLAERGADLPTGLRLLRVEPEPWDPLDSLAFVLLMAEDLSFWQGRPEEERFRWLQAFGAVGVRELLDEPSLHVPAEILELAESAGRPAEPEAAARRIDPDRRDFPTPGSNNWAVGAGRTAGGRAMVANDPHLGLVLPGVWYQVMIRSPEYEAAGMTLPGTPGVVLGRGPDVAWAFTNTMLDDHDVFFERLDETGERYLRDGAWHPLRLEQETIHIRGGGEHTVTLRATDLGPLLDADPEAGLPPRSLAWTLYEPGDPFRAMRDLSQAATVEEALAAIEGYVCPAQNLVAAFAGGELLYTVIGRVPQRRLGLQLSSESGEAPPEDGLGRLPSPGWNSAYGWDGLRPRATNPTVVAPAEGRLVTANHDIRPPGYPLSLAAEFYTPHRARRIAELLDQRNDWDARGFGELQGDHLSLYARDLVAAIDGDYDGDAGRAWEALSRWDGAMALEGPAALYAMLERRLRTAIFADEAAAVDLERFDDRAMLLRLLRGGMGPRWFDDVATPEEEGRREILARELAAAWREGRERWGGEVAGWDYGWLHSLTLRHRLDRVPVFGRWARRGPYPMIGSSTTVAAFGGRWEVDRQRVTHGPSMRWIVDWSQSDRAFAALPGGQSGHPADRHYDDRLAPYLAGELQSAAWSEELIAAAAVSAMRLVP